MSEESIKYLEKEFNQYYKDINGVSHYLFEKAYGNEPEDSEKNYDTNWTNEYLYRMYNILCVYFETLELNGYLKTFKEEFEPIIKDKVLATEIIPEFLHYGDFELDLSLLIKWKKFLAPFDFFFTKENEKNRIIPFLESTNEILKLTKTDVYKEEDINSILRSCLKLSLRLI